MANSFLLWTFIFLMINITTVGTVLRLTTRSKRGQQDTPAQRNVQGEEPSAIRIDLTEVMGWEFEYARITASEAMRDRHTMLNYYLILIGIIASVLLGYYSKEAISPEPLLGTALLWTFCMVGWVYLLMLVRLRKAWHDSALAMNRIKDFCIDNCGLPPAVASKAFRWRTSTLPTAEKSWNVFFYTAALIALIDSISLFFGGLSLGAFDLLCMPLWVLALLLLMSTMFFLSHIYFYFAFLRPPSPPPS
jgi:hypothetical protein